MMDRRTFLRGSVTAPAGLVAAPVSRVLTAKRTIARGTVVWREFINRKLMKLNPGRFLRQYETYLAKEKYLSTLSESEYQALQGQSLGRMFWEKALGRRMLTVGDPMP